jgi:hypothetical protein
VSSTGEDDREHELYEVPQQHNYAFSSPIRGREQETFSAHATPRSHGQRPAYLQQIRSDESISDASSRGPPVSPKKQKTARNGSVPVSPQKATNMTGSAQRTVSSEFIQQGPSLSPPRRITRSQSRSPELKARPLPAMSRARSSHGAGTRKVSDKENAEPMAYSASQPGKDASFSHPSAAASIMAGTSKQRVSHLRGPSLLDDITFDPLTGAPMMDPAVLNTWLGGPSGPSTPVLGSGDGPHGDKGLLGFRQETSHVRAESNVSVSQWIHMPPVQE